MSNRRVVVVDVETSALHSNPRIPVLPLTVRRDPTSTRPYGVVVEVGWWDLSTGEHGTFVPPHDSTAVLAFGDPAALEVNRYRHRLATAEQDDGTQVGNLHERLTGATVAGANPAFDVAFLRQLFDLAGLTTRNLAADDPWHHRLLDLEAYFAGARGIDGGALIGLRDIALEVGTEHRPDHTALGDALACGEALYALGAVQPLVDTP